MKKGDLFRTFNARSGVQLYYITKVTKKGSWYSVYDIDKEDRILTITKGFYERKDAWGQYLAPEKDVHVFVMCVFKCREWRIE
jgi:hypothetical protein